MSWLCQRCRIVSAEKHGDWAGLRSWHRLIRLIGPTYGQCPRRLSRFSTVREDPSPVGLGLSHLSEVGGLRAWTSAPRPRIFQKSFHRESSFPCLSRHCHFRSREQPCQRACHPADCTFLAGHTTQEWQKATSSYHVIDEKAIKSEHGLRPRPTRQNQDVIRSSYISNISATHMHEQHRTTDLKGYFLCQL